MDSRRRRIAFIQTVPFELVGIQSLAARLKEHDIRVYITYIDPYGSIVKDLLKFRPDFVCFTACTGDHDVLLKMAADMKAAVEAPYIWGGPHPTFFPDIIEQRGVDIVVRGEADDTLPRVIADPRNTGVEGVWFKNPDGTVIRNGMGRLIKDLNSLPFPDRSVYRRRYRTLPYSSLNVLAGRGCPFNCTFCYNQSLKDMYREDYASGGYVRLRSPENIVAEIKEYIRQYGRPRYVHFRDDTFIFNRKWLERFLAVYADEIGIPFTCLGRADLIDDELARDLKKAGLSMFFWAIESGSERLRNGICGKNIPDQQIISCGEILNRHEIPFRVYNMMGLPTETYEEAMATVSINQAIGNRYPLSTVYEPYPGTKLTEMATMEGLLRELPPEKSRTQYDGAYVKCDERIMRIHKLFFWFVLFPKINAPLYGWIQKDHTAINKILFYIGYAYVFYKTYKYTLWEMTLLVLRMFRPLVTFKS